MTPTSRTTNYFHTPLADTVSGASVDAGRGVSSSVSKKPDLSDFPVSRIREAAENHLLYDEFNPVNADDADLITTIREHGILSPLTITQDDVLISGHRRLNAARHLHLDSVPVIVEPVKWYGLTEQERLELLKAPNTQREKSRNERLRETMLDVNRDSAYGDLLQHRAESQKVKVASNVSMGAFKGRARITTIDFLNKAKAVIESQRDDWPMTVRRAHYLLLNDPPLRHDKKPDSRYGNTKTDYQALSNLLVRARLNGDIPTEAIEDPTRPISTWYKFNNPADFVKHETESFLRGYYRDLMQGQEHHVEILVEKDGLRKIVENVAHDYTIPCTVGKGYSSVPPRVAMADRFIRSGKSKLVLLILADFDPDGEQIAVSFPRSLRDDFGIDRVHPVKVLLNSEDVARYNLPSDLEAKPGSSNYRRFVDKYGTAVTELDAAPKELIQDRLRQSIESVIDVATYNEQVDAEADDWKWIDAHRRLAMQSLGMNGGVR